jgi:hypothetical protein
MNQLRTLALATVLAAIAAPAQSQIVNGGFETGSLSGWSQSGICNFTGADGLSAHTGAWGLLTGPEGGSCTISQNIATTIGQQYTFSFWFRNDGDDFNLFNAFFGANQLLQLTNETPFDWTFKSFLVTATTSSTNVGFQVRHEEADWHVDDVGVTRTTTTPEPSSILLLATGFVGLGVAVRRRRA